MKGTFARMMATALPAHQVLAADALPAGLGTAFLLFWLSCFAGTTDLANWYMENILVVLFVAVLALTYRRFRFGNISYTCFFLFLCLHTYGAKYAYADNVFGHWLQVKLQLWRNPYDRIVHTSFGVLMVCPMRDLLTRRLKLRGRLAWLLPVEMVLSLAGLFELVEWAVADILFPAHGKNYVGTQGDSWDAQKDMAVALAGALAATLVVYLAKRHLQVFTHRASAVLPGA